MATNWANKFNNRWFVRVDGRGIPVYGSLINRAYKPKGYGNSRFIEVTACIPNQICCTPEPNADVIATTIPGDFEVGGSITYTLSNTDGQISSYTATNGASASATLTTLVGLLNTDMAGIGTFSVDGNDIVLTAPIYEGLSATATYTAAP